MHKLIDIDFIQLSRYQSAAEADKPTAEDIQFAENTGILTPVLVRQIGNKAFPAYELLGEEKSWFLAQQLMLPKVPAVILDNISNLDAKNMLSLRRRGKKEDPIHWAKEAESFLNTKRTYNLHYSISDAAKDLGVERTRLSHALRLINRLHPDIQAKVSEGKIKVGHARRLASLPFSDQLKLAKKILLHHLSVRNVEEAVKDKLESGHAKLIDDPIKKPAYLTRLEAKITETLSVKSEIDYEESSQSGELRLTYHNLEELQGILDRLGVYLDN